MRGTFLNVAAIAVGTGLGVLLGARLPERVRATVMDGLGLFTVILGVHTALDAFGDTLTARVGRASVLVVLGALLAGGAVGELLDLDGRLARLGEALQRRATSRAGTPVTTRRRVAADGSSDDGGSRFVEGFVVASLVFSVGPLALLGALQDGLAGDYQLLAVKSLLDGFAALGFSSVLGVGVGFAALPVFALQASVSLSAGLLEPVVTEAMVAATSAVGGVLVVAIGLRLLELRHVRVANLLPGIVLAPLVVALWP